MKSAYSYIISSSKIDFRTTAPAPHVSRVLTFSTELVSPELPAMIGFLSVIPMYVVERSMYFSFPFFLHESGWPSADRMVGIRRSFRPTLIYVDGSIVTSFLPIALLRRWSNWFRSRRYSQATSAKVWKPSAGQPTHYSPRSMNTCSSAPRNFSQFIAKSRLDNKAAIRYLNPTRLYDNENCRWVSDPTTY